MVEGEVGFTDGFPESGHRDSPYYTTGWIIASVVPVVDIVADLRDLSQNLASGDSMEAALGAAGLIPILGKAGDTAKVVKIILKYVRKFPAKAADLSKVLTRVVLKHAPLDSSRVYKAMGYDDAVARLKADGLADGDIEQLVGRLDETESLDDVKHAWRVGDEVIYLTKGRWEHIISRHITGTDIGGRVTDFFPTGRVIPPKGQRPARQLPNEMNMKAVKDLIELTYRRAEPEDGDDVAYVLNPGKHGYNYGIDQMRVVIVDGKIITAYPESGSKVLRWNDDKGIWVHNPDLT